MTDVDRELQSLLAVDPSPEFVARVRTRIAAEPEPQPSVAGLRVPTGSEWWWSWTLAAAPILAAAVILIAVFAWRPRPLERVPTLTEISLPSTTTVLPYVVPGPAEAGRYVSTAESEAVVDPRETAALRALISGIRTGNVDLEPVLRASVPSAMDLAPIDEIAIPPITIAPLVEEGARQ